MVVITYRLCLLAAGTASALFCFAGLVNASPVAPRVQALTGHYSQNLYDQSLRSLTPRRQAPLLPTAFFTASEPQPADAWPEDSAPGVDRYDFGTHSTAASTAIQHLFLLRNGTGQVMTIQRVQPTCGCTTAFAGDRADAPPPSIAPGGWVPVHVSVDPGHLAAGPIRKSVNIFVAGQLAPAAVLLVTGTLAGVATADGMPRATPSAAADLAPRLPSTPAVRSQALHLTVVGEGASASPSLSEGHYDFGHAIALSGRRIEHTFLLRNDSDMPLHLGRLQPSCGCTSAVVDAPSGSSSSPPAGIVAAPVIITASVIIIAPHGEIKVHQSIDTTHLAAGPIEKYLWVFIQGQGDTAAILRTTGILDAGAVFSPNTLDFGRVPAGNMLARRLHLTLNPQLSAPGQSLIPRLMTSSSDLVIRSLDPQASQSAENNGLAVKDHAYEISLSPHAHLGLIDGNLSLLLVSPTGSVQAIDASVSLRGEVIGQVSAEPQSIAFGSVASGAASVQEIIVRGKSENALQGLKAATNSPYLIAKFSGASTHRGPTGTATRVLRISLSPRLPVGSLATQVNITLPDGQQLVLPASVDVVEPLQHP